MFIQYSIFFVIISLTYCYSWKHIQMIIFDSDEYMKSIVNNNTIDALNKNNLCNKLYYEHIIKNEFICAYKYNNNQIDLNKNSLNFIDRMINILKDTFDM